MATKELRDQLFKFFSEGNPPHADKIKALVEKAGSRNLYYAMWKRLGKPDHVPEKREKIIRGGVGEAVLPSGETVGGIDELTQPVQQVEAPPKPKEPEEGAPETEEEVVGETKEPKIELGLDETDKQSVSADVVGFGLPIRVQLSIKTLALYQIAASRSDDGLSLGDFIDSCAEDYFKGRGVDLGLVELKGGENAR